MEGFHVGMDEAGLEAWVRSWDAGPALLARIAREATEFLVTFPVGFNPHLDTVVARTPWLRRMARVLRRVDAANRWEVDPEARFDYKYDYRDTYDSEYVGYVYHPRLPEVYKRAFGQRLVSAPQRRSQLERWGASEHSPSGSPSNVVIDAAVGRPEVWLIGNSLEHVHPVLPSVGLARFS